MKRGSSRGRRGGRPQTIVDDPRVLGTGPVSQTVTPVRREVNTVVTAQTRDCERSSYLFPMIVSSEWNSYSLAPLNDSRSTCLGDL